MQTVTSTLACAWVIAAAIIGLVLGDGVAGLLLGMLVGIGIVGIIGWILTHDNRSSRSRNKRR